MIGSNALRTAVDMVDRNSTTILTGLGVSGVVTTAYLTGKASFIAAGVIQHEEDRSVNYTAPVVSPKQRLKDRTKLVWRFYIPALATGGVTIACIIGATKIGANRTAAVTAAYTLTDKAFDEYRKKVVEQVGEKKEQSVRDSIAEDKVRRSPPPETLISGPGNVLCHEQATGRYFTSDMETLRRAQNDINAKVLAERFVTIDDFYHLIGLPGTSFSSEFGWDSDKLMELQFTTVLTDDGRPCLSFDYNYTSAL